MLVPLARRWVDIHETRILRRGISLNVAQRSDARRAGVNHVEQVRLLRVSAIPLPFGPILRRISRRARVISRDTLGITFGHGIYLREDWSGDRALLVHELVHVAQYERYGSSGRFLYEYLRECLLAGYPNGPLEQEALARTREICG